MQKGNATLVTIISIIVVIGGLFLLPRFLNSNATNGLVSKTNTTVPCLVSNLPLLQHIHPELTIEVGGKNEIVPAQIGLTGPCERAVHTHDATGVIHVEAQDSRNYTLGDFFSVWGKDIERTGYKLEMTVDDKVSTEFGKLILKDKQKIKLIYTKVTK